MSNKEIEILDEVLEEEVVQEENKPKKGKKKIIVAIIAGFSAVAVAISGLVLAFGKKKNQNTTNNTNTTTTSAFDLTDLGAELEIPTSTTKKMGSVVSGTADLSKVTEQNGKLYVDKENASKAQNKTTSIDLKGGSLKTDSKGTVYDKTTGYIIKDETGKTIATGNLNESGIPDGYAYDPVLKKYIPKEEVGKYVYADATYYDEAGNEVLKKGDVVAKETLEKAKKYFSTTTVKNNSTTSTKAVATTTTTAKKNTASTTKKTTTTTTINSDEGVINPDGTYTIYGMTFESKADYQQWVLQGYEGYAEVDGIMKSEEEIQKQLVK